MNRQALAAALRRMLPWTAGILILIQLAIWLSPRQDGEPTLPGWGQILVWAILTLPVVPAAIAGASRLPRRAKRAHVALGVIVGILTPVLGLVILVGTLLLTGGNVDLESPVPGLSDQAIAASLMMTVVLLGVATALGADRASPDR